MFLTITLFLYSVLVLTFSLLLWRRVKELESKVIGITTHVEKHQEHKLSLLTNSIVGVGHQVSKNEKRLRYIEDAQVETHYSSDSNYDYAISLVESGASCEEVAASTGLSTAEVQLIENVHRYKEKN